MKTITVNYKFAFGIVALLCATTVTVLAANCLLPTDIDEAGSCGGTPHPSADYPDCQIIVYNPDHRSECDPSPNGTYTCNNVIAHVLKITYQYRPLFLHGDPPITGCIMAESTSSTVDTGQLCLQGQAGTDSCP
jgi:hypothetical protein